MQVLLMPILNGNSGLSLYSRVVSPEFFDELKILSNFIDGKGLTFDGVHQSSGFYPLWLGYLWVLVKIFGAGGKGFFVAYKIATILMLLFSLWMFVELCAKWNISANVSYVAGLYFVVAYLYQASSGQSTQLAIVFMLLIVTYLPKFLADHSFKKAIILGLLLSLAGLTRTDTLVIVISFVIAYCILDDKYEAKNIDALFKYRNLLGLLLGTTPLLAFYVYNYYKFGDTLPAIDAYLLQKQSFVANTDLWKQIFVKSVRETLSNPIRFFSVSFAIWITLGSFLVLIMRPKDKAFNIDKSIYALLVFNAIVYYAIFSFVTHWKPFGIHFYLLVITAPFCVAKAMQYMLDKLDTDNERLAMKVVINFFGLVFAFVIVTVMNNPLRSSINYDVYSLAKPFAKKHKAVYAMGNGAGLASFVIDRTIVPLEGKTTNAKFLKDRREADELQDLLVAYGARYYIGVNLLEQNSCYYAEEPNVIFSGQGSLKTYTWFCSAPVFMAEHNNDKIYIFEIPKVKN